jgi:transposase
MEEGRRGRRRHSAEFKRQVLAECAQPGVSVAGVALAHRINANLVQKWRRQARGGGGGAPRVDATFVPVAVSPVAAPTSAVAPAPIQIEVRRGAVSARIQWPVSAAADCATWLREWLG